MIMWCPYMNSEKTNIELAPDSVNAEFMTDAEIYEKLTEGLEQAEQRKVYDAREALADLRNKISEQYI